MKKLSYLLMGLVLMAGFVSCQKEEALTPSNVETDRLIEQLDLTKPLVKEYKEKYNVNILYNFDDNLDVKYNMIGLSGQLMWNELTITHLAAENVDYALNKLQEMVLNYYTKDEFKSKFQHFIFLTDALQYGNTSNIFDPLATECSYNEIGYATGISTEYSYLFAINKQSITTFEAAGAEGQQKLNVLRGVKLYSLTCSTIERNKLYKEVPAEFYNVVSNVHNQSIDTIAHKEPVLPLILGSKTNYDPQWFINLGFAITKNFPSKDTDGYNSALKVNFSNMFPSKERDFRNFLNVVFCEIATPKVDNITNYYLKSPLFKRRMVIVLDLLDKWGIDYLSHNPQLAEFRK